MADFFTRLVGRTLGTTPTVQPMQTPMFALETNMSSHEPTGWDKPASPLQHEGQWTNDPMSAHTAAASSIRDASIRPSARETFRGQAQDGLAQGATPTMQEMFNGLAQDGLTQGAAPTMQEMFRELAQDGLAQGAAPTMQETFREQAQDGLAQRTAPTMQIPLQKDMPASQTLPHTDHSMPFVPQQDYVEVEFAPPRPTKSSESPSDERRVASVGTRQAQGATPMVPVGEVEAHTDQTGHNVLPTGFRIETTLASPIPTIRHFAGRDGQAPILSPISVNGTPLSTGHYAQMPVPEIANHLTSIPTQRSWDGGRAQSYSDQWSKPAGDVESASPSPEPIIQVTIGRIEVRATPPTPPLAQRKKPAVMGLEEYLDQRAKGGR